MLRGSGSEELRGYRVSVQSSREENTRRRRAAGVAEGRGSSVAEAGQQASPKATAGVAKASSGAAGAPRSARARVARRSSSASCVRRRRSAIRCSRAAPPLHGACSPAGGHAGHRTRLADPGWSRQRPPCSPHPPRRAPRGATARRLHHVETRSARGRPRGRGGDRRLEGGAGNRAGTETPSRARRTKRIYNMLVHGRCSSHRRERVVGAAGRGVLDKGDWSHRCHPIAILPGEARAGERRRSDHPLPKRTCRV